jgi:hypothetical protein
LETAQAHVLGVEIEISPVAPADGNVIVRG